MNLSSKTLYVGVAVTVLGLAVGVYFFLGTGGNESEAAGDIVVRPKEYDLGRVDFGGGVVKRDFSVKNLGETDLKIKSIKTSCKCTEAQLIREEEKSKKFGMHPFNLLWSAIIPPGEEGTLRVLFDPDAHGAKGLGPFVRTISIKSSDPDDREKKTVVRLTGSVVR